MASRAPVHGNIRRLLANILEMAEETGSLCYGHVRSLDDLGMAGGASELFLTPHLLNMAGMAEEHVLEHHVVFQI